MNSLHEIGRFLQTWSPVFYYLAAPGLLIAAFVQYRSSKKLERAKWMVQLYEKFYEEPRFKRMRAILDCAGQDSAEVNQIVDEEELEFTDYLNFFEFVSYLTRRGELDDEDVEALFGYYMDCLNNQHRVKQYIHDASKGFEQLSKRLEKRAHPAA
jgi:hypothetical protein